MKTTDVKIGEAAHKAILRGVNAVYDVVKMTLGPEGRNALIYRTYNRGSRITNDGKTIAEVIEPQDEHENLAANAFKVPIKRTDEQAGDGTTSTTVVAGHLINKIFRGMAEKAATTIQVGGNKKRTTDGVMTTRKKMLEASKLVVEAIKKVAKPVKTLKDLEKIAFVSTEDEALSKVIAGMVWELGVDNHIDILEGFKGEIETEKVFGMRFAAKVPAQVFINRLERFEMIVEDSPVIVTNYTIDNPITLKGILESLPNVNKITICAPSFSDSVLLSLHKSKEGGYLAYPVKCPSLKDEVFEDLATYCGGKFINKNIGKKLENIQLSDLGFFEKMIVKFSDARDDAVLFGGRGAKSEAIQERIKVIKEQIKETNVDIHKKLLQKRIASIGSAVGVIRVGATTTDNALYLKLKAEDGVYACKGAMLEGYVEGGGVCLKKIAESLPENILTDSLKEPYEQIQKNCDGYLEISKDIIDPARVVRLTVENAVSAASTMITLGATIPETRDINPGEGYGNIARAIRSYVQMIAKEKGLIKEGEDEAEKDMMSGYEEKLAKDI